ncbi:MAG: hypothetical protein IK061_02020 [Desulfovibrio sp.]|nr:hypothetical protein [Desulfovibrio sp.]
MYTMWTSNHLRRAVSYYLRLLESQRGKGRLTPETVCAVLAERTGHDEAGARKVMNTVSWLLSAQGARLCKGFPPQCDASEDAVMRLENILIRELDLRRRLRLKPWTAEEMQATVACYRRMLEDSIAGRLFSAKDRIAELAISFPRTYASVKEKLCQISWLLEERGLPTVPSIPPVPVPGEKTASLLESFLAGFDAFKFAAAGRRPWKTQELEVAVQTYMALAALEANGASHVPGDTICTLAKQLGRRFSECSLCLSSIVSLRKSLGLEAVRCLPEGEGLSEAERLQLEEVCQRLLPR